MRSARGILAILRIACERQRADLMLEKSSRSRDRNPFIADTILSEKESGGVERPVGKCPPGWHPRSTKDGCRIVFLAAPSVVGGGVEPLIKRTTSRTRNKRGRGQ